MDFDFTTEQQQLRDSVRKWAERDFPIERRRAIAGAGGHCREVYAELAQLGLTGIAVAEQYGGLGWGPVETLVACEELGRALVHVPFVHAAVVAPVLLAAADVPVRAAWLPRVAAGEAVVVLAHQERRARYRLDTIETAAQPDAGGGWTVSGAKSVVPAGDEADALVVPAVLDGRVALLLVEKSHVTRLEACATHDGARAAQIVFERSPATLIARDGQGLLDQAMDAGLAALCAEATGLMERLLELTIDYLQTRQQFGKPLASFQALRHRIVDIKMQLELARSMSYYATFKLGEAAVERRLALSRAKVQVGQSMRLVGQQCLQLHGAIGMTEEYAGSHYFKRLTMLEPAFGDTLHHLGHVSARIRAGSQAGEAVGVFTSAAEPLGPTAD